MKNTKADPTKTVLIISIGFSLVFFFLHFSWAIYIAIIIGLMGILSPSLSKIIEFLWMKLAWILSFIIPNILLALVFYLILFPMSLFSKVFRKADLLNLKNTKHSMFRERKIQFDKESFEKPW